MDEQRDYGMVNNRVFEVMSAGALLITEHFNELEVLLGPWNGARNSDLIRGFTDDISSSTNDVMSTNTGMGGDCTLGAACFLRTSNDLQQCINDASGGAMASSASVGATVEVAGAGSGPAAAEELTAWATSLKESGGSARLARQRLVAQQHTYAHRAPAVLAAAARAASMRAQRATFNATKAHSSGDEDVDISLRGNHKTSPEVAVHEDPIGWMAHAAAQPPDPSFAFLHGRPNLAWPHDRSRRRHSDARESDDNLGGLAWGGPSPRARMDAWSAFMPKCPRPRCPQLAILVDFAQDPYVGSLEFATTVLPALMHLASTHFTVRWQDANTIQRRWQPSNQAAQPERTSNNGRGDSSTIDQAAAAAATQYQTTTGYWHLDSGWAHADELVFAVGCPSGSADVAARALPGPGADSHSGAPRLVALLMHPHCPTELARALSPPPRRNHAHNSTSKASSKGTATDEREQEVLRQRQEQEQQQKQHRQRLARVHAIGLQLRRYDLVFYANPEDRQLLEVGFGIRSLSFAYGVSARAMRHRRSLTTENKKSGGDDSGWSSEKSFCNHTNSSGGGAVVFFGDLSATGEIAARSLLRSSGARDSLAAALAASVLCIPVPTAPTTPGDLNTGGNSNLSAMSCSAQQQQSMAPTIEVVVVAGSGGFPANVFADLERAVAAAWASLFCDSPGSSSASSNSDHFQGRYNWCSNKNPLPSPRDAENRPMWRTPRSLASRQLPCFGFARSNLMEEHDSVLKDGEEELTPPLLPTSCALTVRVIGPEAARDGELDHVLASSGAIFLPFVDDVDDVNTEEDTHGRGRRSGTSSGSSQSSGIVGTSRLEVAAAVLAQHGKHSSGGDWALTTVAALGYGHKIVIAAEHPFRSIDNAANAAAASAAATVATAKKATAIRLTSVSTMTNMQVLSAQDVSNQLALSVTLGYDLGRGRTRVDFTVEVRELLAGPESDEDTNSNDESLPPLHTVAVLSTLAPPDIDRSSVGDHSDSNVDVGGFLDTFAQKHAVDDEDVAHEMVARRGGWWDGATGTASDQLGGPLWKAFSSRGPSDTGVDARSSSSTGSSSPAVDHPPVVRRQWMAGRGVLQDLIVTVHLTDFEVGRDGSWCLFANRHLVTCILQPHTKVRLVAKPDESNDHIENESNSSSNSTVDVACQWLDYDVTFHVELRPTMYGNKVQESKPLVARLSAPPPRRQTESLTPRPWFGPGRALSWDLTPLTRWATPGSPDGKLAPLQYVGCPSNSRSSSSGGIRDISSSRNGNGVVQGPLRVFLGGGSSGKINGPDLGTPLLFASGDRLNGVARAFVATHRMHEKQGAGCDVGDVNCMALAIQGLAEGYLASHVVKVEKEVRDASMEDRPAVGARYNEEEVQDYAAADIHSGVPPKDSGQSEVTAADTAGRRSTTPVAALLKDRMKERLMTAVEKAKMEAEEAAAARAEATQHAAQSVSSTPMEPLSNGKPSKKPDGSWEFILD